VPVLKLEQKSLFEVWSKCGVKSASEGGRIWRRRLESFPRGDRSVRQKRRRLRDRLSDDRKVSEFIQRLFLENCNDRRIAPPRSVLMLLSSTVLEENIREELVEVEAARSHL